MKTLQFIAVVVFVSQTVYGKISEIPDNKKIAVFIRDVIKENNLKSKNIGDVAVFKISEGRHRKEIERIYEQICLEIPEENPVIKPNKSEVVKNQKFWVASFIIVVANANHPQYLFENFKFMEESDYFSHFEKFIFVMVENRNIRPIFTWFQAMGSLNVICVTQFNNELEIYSYNIFMEKTTELFDFYRVDKSSDIDLLFPDKIQNLKGYTMKLQVFHETFNVITDGPKVHGTGIAFLSTIAKKMNAKVNLSIKPEQNSIVDLVSDLFIGKYDFLINTYVKIADKKNSTIKQEHLFKMVNTYETSGMCVLVPYGDDKSLFEFLYKPFDLWTWILIVLSMTVGAIAWKILNLKSVDKFLFFFVAGMLGRSIPLHTVNLRQKIVLQMTVLLTFFLCTLYQSLIISFIFSSRNGEKIKTIEQLLEKNYSFLVDEVFSIMIEDADQYSSLTSRINGTLSVYDEIDYEQMARENVALIGDCSEIHFIQKSVKLQKDAQKKMNQFYYVLDENFYSFYKKIPTAPYSVLYERLEELSLRVFESGIKKFWRKNVPHEDNLALMEREYMEREGFLLDLHDLHPAFFLLVGGITLAFVALILELILHRLSRSLRSKTFVQRFKENDSCKKPKDGPTVRFIQIRQIRPNDEIV